MVVVVNISPKQKLFLQEQKGVLKEQVGTFLMPCPKQYFTVEFVLNKSSTVL